MKNKLLKLMGKNGFLLFLFLCVCLVAGGTIFIATRDLQKPSTNLGDRDLVILEEQNAEKGEGNPEDLASEVAKSIDKAEDNEKLESLEKQVVGVVTEELEEEVEIVEIDEELEFVEEEEEEEEEKDEGEKVTLSSSFTIPAGGEIMGEFTNDSLVYSKTLDEWRGHFGIDIKAEIGDGISAPLDGIIKEVYEDSLWGMVIVIDHGNGLESKFSNVGTMEMVRVGLNVKKGDIISKVGNSADIEMMMDSHIHFETRKDGKLIDPRSISN